MIESSDITEVVYAGASLQRLIALGLALTALIALMVWRESRAHGWRRVVVPALLRVLAVGLVLWMLAEPTARSTIRHVRGKSIAVMVDTSGSMSVADVPAQPVASGSRSRLGEAARVLTEAERTWLRAIETKARVLRYGFSDAAQAVPADDWEALRAAGAGGEAMSTDLAVALQQAVQDKASEDLRAVVLLSDGGHNTSADPQIPAAALAGVPVYVVPLGNPKPVRDVVIHHAQGPRAVLLNDAIVIEATIDAHDCEGEELLVELRSGEQVIAQERVPVPSDAYARRVSFTRKAEEIGLQEFVLQVQPVTEELTVENNHATVSVEVTQGKVRLLLVDAAPRWEFRYLRNLLRRDEQVEFDYLLLSPRSSGTSTGPAQVALPTTLEEWDRYRVVVLGDLGPEELNRQHQQQLADYVGRRGGTLILIGGERMPAVFDGGNFAELLPVERWGEGEGGAGETRYLRVTAEGVTHAVTQLADDALASARLWGEQFGRPGALAVMNAYCLPKPTAHVLLQAVEREGAESSDGRAFLCWQRFGPGKVVYFAAPATYLLRQKHGDLYHHRFWGQLLRWATARETSTGPQTVQLAADNTRYTDGDDVQVRLRLRRVNGEPVEASGERVVARQGESAVGDTALAADPEVPGLLRGTLRGLPTGTIELEATGGRIPELLHEEGVAQAVTTTVVVEPAQSLEMRSTRCNLPLLTRIAETTGGKVTSAANLAGTMSELDLSPQVSRTITQQPLWDRWAYLWLVVGCLTLEWGLRKGMGLA